MQRNVAILKRVVDVIKVLAKQNLAFRGPSNNDSLYQLENLSINHGNFLELINLLGKYDEVLGIHLKNAILKSKQRRDQTIAGGKTGHQAGGRGSLITFLSKTIVNRIINIICDKIKSKIAAEAGRKIFSIQIDSSQDIAVVISSGVVRLPPTLLYWSLRSSPPDGILPPDGTTYNIFLFHIYFNREEIRN